MVVAAAVDVISGIEDPTTDYARAVVAGEIRAGRLVRLACQRHLDDLEHGHERGLYFDLRAARRIFRFFERKLRYPDGEHAGERFHLEPFQKFILGSAFGWMKRTGPRIHRRFRTVFVEIGKGNGKTPIAAGVALYGLARDHQVGAQIYSFASAKEQSRLSFTDAKNMAEASDLADELEIGRQNIAYLATRSFFRALSSEIKVASGQRVHIAIGDEVHEMPNSDLIRRMEKGTKSDLNAILFFITNSGFEQTDENPCWSRHDRGVKILEKVYEDDSYFAYICQLDPCEKCQSQGKVLPDEKCDDCDDWRDESTWLKANPGLDTILDREYLRGLVNTAKVVVSEQNDVRRFNFCQWTEQANRWIAMTDWDACPSKIDLEALRGRACYGGIDLSTKIDLTAWNLVFPPPEDDGIWIWLTHGFIPKATIRERERSDRIPYSIWAEEGLLTATEGNIVDYEVVRARIEADAKLYSLQEIGFDPYAATQLSTQLIEKGFTMVEVRQGMLSMSEPSKYFEALVMANRLNHGGNRLLRWCVSNLIVITDGKENKMPVKPKSTKRIDPVVAGIIAMSRAIRNVGATERPRARLIGV